MIMTRAQLRERPSRQLLPHERGARAQVALAAPEAPSLSNLIQELARKAMLNEQRVVDSKERQGTLSLCQEVHDEQFFMRKNEPYHC